LVLLIENVNLMSKIEYFWNEILVILKNEDYQNLDVIFKIENLLEDFKGLSWEIGPLSENQMYFAISPNLDPELRIKASNIVSEAPYVPGWTFFDCKQQKANFESVKIHSETEGSITVNIENWEFLILAEECYKDLYIDVFIPEKIPTLNRNEIIEIVLINAIGEAHYIDYVYQYNLIESIDEENQSKTIDVFRLQNFFEKLALKHTQKI
jgi:hypothetical protein